MKILPTILAAFAAATLLASALATQAGEPMTFTADDYKEVLKGVSENWTCAEFLEVIDETEDGKLTARATLTRLAWGAWGQGYAQGIKDHGNGGAIALVTLNICQNHPDVLFSEIGK